MATLLSQGTCSNVKFILWYAWCHSIFYAGCVGSSVIKSKKTSTQGKIIQYRYEIAKQGRSLTSAVLQLY